MKRILHVVMVAGMLAMLAGAASAHPRSIDRREARQHFRIHNGVMNGSLTRAEARRLVRGQRHVWRMERRGRADGNLSFREHARIQRALNRQSRHIYRFKHNARGRWA